MKNSIWSNGMSGMNGAKAVTRSCTDAIPQLKMRGNWLLARPQIVWAKRSLEPITIGQELR